jgi:hypothetical protein
VLLLLLLLLQYSMKQEGWGDMYMKQRGAPPANKKKEAPVWSATTITIYIL